jgi:hypothetical protein
VVGFVTGGPAGAALLSQAGGALGDLTNDIIDASEGNVPVEQIFVRLAQNAASIAKGAGVDLSRELDGILGAEGLRSGSAYSELLGKLEPALSSLPRMLDDKSVRRSFAELGVSLRGQGFSDIPELGSIADSALAILGDPGERALDNPDAFRSAVRNGVVALPDQAKDSLRRSVGLDDNADEKEIGERIANLALANLVGEANRIRQEQLQTFVTRNLDERKSWDSPPVLRELEALLKKLYPGNPAAQEEVREAIKRSLPNQKTYQARIQQLLTPWRADLDKRLAKMQKELDEKNYSGAQGSELAERRLEALEKAAKVFEDDVVPFLNRQTRPDPAADLLRRLEEEVQKIAGAEDDVKIAELKQKLEGLNLSDAMVGLRQAETLLKIAQDLSGAAALESDAASVRVRIAEIGKKQAETQGEAADALKNAAVAREKAANERIEAALARLDESKARLAAAQKRGAEAAWIREAVSRPPLLGRVAASQAGRLALIMRNHARELNRGLAASRDLQRLYRAIKSDAPPAADSYLNEMNPDNFDLGTWGASLQNQAAWIDDNEGVLSAQALTEVLSPLTTEQVTAMRGPFGLKLVHTFEVTPEESEVLRPDGSVFKPLAMGTRGETSRIVAILLYGKTTDGREISDVGQFFNVLPAQHQGDLRLSDGSVATLGERRLHRCLPTTTDAARTPIPTLLALTGFAASEGAPRSNLVQGVPMSGTLVIRINSQVPIQSLGMTLVYSFTSAD